jgi:uncharacterized protein
MAITLSIFEGRFAVCRLSAQAAIPGWALNESFFSITRTLDELSIVCPERSVPAGEVCERGWHCLKVQGPLDFSMTGVMASLAAPLAEAAISIFTISTFDTDYLFVKEKDFERALLALTSVGHTVEHQSRGRKSHGSTNLTEGASHE